MANAIKKTAAIALAAGLTFAGSAGIAAQDAFAQTTNTAAPVPASNVPDASGIGNDPVNLTINKRVNPTELRNATGEEDADASGQPLAGVGFTAERIKIDITKQENFNKVAKLANERDIEAAKALGLETPVTFDDTNAQGQTSKQLPVGAYIITETKTPDVKDGETYVPAEPFIVFLPMTSSDGKSWNRDVQVYPKNSYAKVTKTVIDKDKNTESTAAQGEEGKPGYLGPRPAENAVVEYTLDGVVPAAPQNRELKTLTLTDASKKEELRWDEGFIEGVFVVRGGEEVPIDAKNYTVNEKAAVPTTNTDGLAAGANQAFTVAVDAQKAGLKPGETVRVKVKATMLKDDGTSKGIENSVRESFVFRNPSTDTDDEPKETPDDKVVTYVGDISIYKHGQKEGEQSSKPLAGAVFEIGKCNEKKDGLEGGAIQTGITNAEGNLTFPGLHVTDYVNDAEVTDTVANYCVVETKAPEGFATPKGKAATHEITLTRTTNNALNQDKTEFEAVSGESTKIANGAVVKNEENTVPLLPSTGGMGILIVALAGLAIIGGGAYAARRNSQSA
ncbi:SpaH/EbpB family LPXTG-anchored major pilin [Corynebacterium sp. Marseille-P3884]|uniref:SpaH/EbpB family LPXTG-anchored major pilin n=1 Tax=Corynebacterium sp. Marseille-P3884 TaxID=2495409 RepID=UPI001B31FE16|nr:SpaH/EbpB family LPXTG-anchored major pilin [Corynebacterium sp. Marseille-P3884]MBP3949464.1 SpaH/EbpB family LPXTG-anchored major pilin [Corynebacterium sp. Marseille-P3884]